MAATWKRRGLIASWLSLALVLACAAAVHAEGIRKVYAVDIPAFAPLDSLPGAQVLNPPGPVRSIRISQVPVTYKMEIDGERIVEFTAPGYRDDNTDTAYIFGPTMRVRRNQSMVIRLSNELILEPSSQKVDKSQWGYRHPMATNLHRHGLHSDTGVSNQATGRRYTGGDNVFVTIPPKNSTTAKAKTLVYRTRVSSDHMPGMHWYHPHREGSTALQTGTSHGIIIVEHDPAWLPWNRGKCNQLNSIIKSARDVVLDIQLLFFQNSPIPPLQVENPNYQQISNASLPKNPLCCDNSSFGGKATEGEGQNLLLLNGGYQPVMQLPADTWQRWRMLFSGPKGWLVLQIIDAETKQPAPECEWQLLSKDGIFMMTIPRKVPALLLPAGGRLEMLTRCKADPGRKFILSGTNTADPFNPGVSATFQNDVFRLPQEVIATIEIQGSQKAAFERLAAEEFQRSKEEGDAPVASFVRTVDRSRLRSAAAAASVRSDDWLVAPLSFSYNDVEPDSCTPRRAAYAADMRDVALAEANIPADKLERQVVNFTPDGDGQGMFCAVNNQLYKFPDPQPIQMELGKIVEWSFNAVRFHPIHTHINPFQVVFFNTSQLMPGTAMTDFFREGDFYDNLLVPMLGEPVPFTSPDDAVRIRFQPGPYTGYSVMHCHFLNHEDLGCMKIVQWKCPGYENEQPADGECPDFDFLLPGDTTTCGGRNCRARN